MNLSGVSLSKGRLVPKDSPDSRGIQTHSWLGSFFHRTVKAQVEGKTQRVNVNSSFKFVKPKEKLPGATKEERIAAKKARKEAREAFLKLKPELIVAQVQARVDALNQSKAPETPPAPPPEAPPILIRRLAESSNERISPDFTAENLLPIWESRKEAISNPVVKNFFASIETSHPELHQVLMPHMDNPSGAQLKITQLGPSLAIPNTNALRSIADKYADKYEVNIKVISLPKVEEAPPPDEEDDAYYDYINSRDDVFKERLNNTKQLLISQIREELQDKTPRSIGMIFDVDGKSHVVPLLLKMENEEAQILVLDILGSNPRHAINKAVLDALQELQLPFAQCRDKRQADMRSCRIGSVVTLRNALLTLKENQEAALQPFENCVSSDDVSGRFNLPPAWGGANDQIFRPSEPADDILNPRQAYSKAPDKHVETIKESRQRHRVEIPFQFELSLYHDTADLADIKLPDGVQLEILAANQLKIKWTAFKQLNGYMLTKGRKEAGLDTPSNLVY